LVDKVAVTVARHFIGVFVTLLLEAGHGHTLLPKNLRVDLIICIFLLDLRSLVHEQIKELFALFLHVTLIVVNEQRLHDEFVESM
jgi:hypothetical protein